MHVIPGAIIGGVISGCCLAVLTGLIKTGYMQRGMRFYRFRDQPILFILDTIMMTIGFLFGIGWIIGYSLQWNAA